MEKRSRRRIRDLENLSASEGLFENESGCARISIMAKSTKALLTGRIQMCKTNPSVAHIGLATHGRSKSMMRRAEEQLLGRDCGLCDNRCAKMIFACRCKARGHVVSQERDVGTVAVG